METTLRPHLIRAAIIGEFSFLLLFITAYFATESSILSFPFIWILFGILIFLSPALGAAAIVTAEYATKRISSALQIMKFGLVGVLNTLVDVGFFTILTALTGVTSTVAVTFFKILSFIIAVINSYLWNKFWVFGGLGNGITKRGDLKEMLSFLSVSVGGLIANIVAFTIFLFILQSIEAIPQNIVGLLAAFGASFASLFWNFIGYKLFVFKK